MKPYICQHCLALHDAELGECLEAYIAAIRDGCIAPSPVVNSKIPASLSAFLESESSLVSADADQPSFKL